MPNQKKKETTIPSNVVGETSSVPFNVPQKSVTPELIERRAREIALLKGRNLDEIHESDRRQARLEFLGPAAGPARKRRKPNNKPKK